MPNSGKSRDLRLDLLSSGLSAPKVYTETYKESVFWCWYHNGKPRPAKLHGLIEPTPENLMPSEITIKKWIEEFKLKAEPLDRQVLKIVEERSITEKVEMLTRHASIGQDMQSLALDYLDKNKEKLNQNSAVRLLVEGIRIERESRGLPTMIAKISESSDEDLMKQIRELMEDAGSIVDAQFEPDEIEKQLGD